MKGVDIKATGLWVYGPGKKKHCHPNSPLPSKIAGKLRTSFPQDMAVGTLIHPCRWSSESIFLKPINSIRSHHLYGCVWKCCVPLFTQWFCWSLSLLNGYLFGNIPYFQTNPYVFFQWPQLLHQSLRHAEIAAFQLAKALKQRPMKQPLPLHEGATPGNGWSFRIKNFEVKHQGMGPETSETWDILAYFSLNTPSKGWRFSPRFHQQSEQKGSVTTKVTIGLTLPDGETTTRTSRHFQPGFSRKSPSLRLWSPRTAWPIPSMPTGFDPLPASLNLHIWSYV